MNSYDYAKQLTKDRTQLRDAVAKTNEATRKQVEHLEDQHRNLQKKMKETHIQDVAELSKDYKETLEKVQEKTAKTLDDKKEIYAKNLKNKQEDFEKTAQSQRQDFNKRLSDIRSSYEKSLSSSEETNRNIEKAQKDRYQANLNRIRHEAEEQTKYFQDKAKKIGGELEHKGRAEKDQLVASHESKLHELQKTKAREMQEFKLQETSNLNKVQAAHTNEKDQLARYNNDKITRLQNAYEDRFKSQAEDYSQKTADNNEQVKTSTQKLNKAHQEELAKVQADFNKKLRHIENERRRRDNGTGEFAEVVKEQQGLTDRAIADNKYKRLNNQLKASQAEFNERAERDLENYKTTLNQEASEAVALRERKVREVEVDKLKIVAKEREKAHKKITLAEDVNRHDRAQYERKLMIEKDGSENRITKLKDTYTKSLAELENKHLDSVASIKESSINDKNEFIAKSNEQRNEEIFNLKRDFSTLMDRTVQDYENRLAKYERDNEYLKMTLNQKISEIVYQTDKKLEEQSKLYEQKKAADAKSTQLLMDQREAALKKERDQLIANFQRKLDKTQVENNSKLKLITNEYEAKLKELKASTSQEIALKDNQHLIEQQRVKEAYEAEKARLIASFENQIESMKQGHQQQLDSLREYKRLS